MLQLRIIILHADPTSGQKGGQIQVFVDSGTFEEAKAATLSLVQAAQAQGIPLEIVGEVEQHRPDGSPHVHITRQMKEQKHGH